MFFLFYISTYVYRTRCIFLSLSLPFLFPLPTWVVVASMTTCHYRVAGYRDTTRRLGAPLEAPSLLRDVAQRTRSNRNFTYIQLRTTKCTAKLLAVNHFPFSISFTHMLVQLVTRSLTAVANFRADPKDDGGKRVGMADHSWQYGECTFR